jgi:hypothetical protein
MAQIGDAFTVGMILILIFGGVFFYLYTRLTQAEKKVSLLESILLDLKAATEGCFMGFPEHKAMPEYYEEADGGDEEDDVLQNLPFAHADADAAVASGSSTPKSNRSAGASADEYRPMKTIAVPSSGAGLVGTSIEDLEIPDAAPVGTEFSVNKVSSASSEPNYDNMSMKELQTLARNRGVSGISSMRRQKLISTLKDLDVDEESPVEESAGPSGFNFGSAAVENDGLMSDLVESATPL